MDFLSSLAKGGDSKNPQPTAGDEKKSSSSSDLFSDAKVVAEAARAQFGNQPEKCDKAKAAGSAADLLDAASDYSKLDETKGVGKYVDQAEGYLRQYSAPKSAGAGAGEEKPAPTTATHAAAAAAVAEAEIPSGGGAGEHVKETEEHVEKPAEDLLGKPSHGGEKAESGGGYGDMMKAAGGFFNK